MPDTRMVIIRNPAAGQEGAILPRDFTIRNRYADGKSYAEQGWVIERYEDGSPFGGPKSQREIEQASAARQPARPSRAEKS